MAFDYIDYWNHNYENGGNSGSGSYGLLAEFKAEIINNLIQEHGIQRVMELGCGDGNQLRYMHYGQYLGLDVAASSIRMCAELFRDDPTKSFILYAPGAFVNRGYLQAELVVCLDVLYHITEEADFSATLRDIFQASSDWVVLYTKITDGNEAQTVQTIKDRNIMSYLSLQKDFELQAIVRQRHPELSSAHFLILQRKQTT